MRPTTCARTLAPAVALAMALFAGDLALAQAPQTARKPRIVVSTTQIADFTRNIVGDDAEVHCILAPGADPHMYETRPSDAALAATADLLIQNGLNLEGRTWMANLARNAGKPLIAATDGIKPLELDEDGHSVPDPHAWFSVTNAAQYVRNIRDAVSRIDPPNAPRYAARAELYLAQLRALDQWIRKQVATIPPDRRLLVTSHDAFGYFCNDYGFRHASPVGWSTGDEIGGGATAARRKQVTNQIREMGIRAVFIETSVDSKLIEQIAREAGVKVAGELYSDSMGPAGSAGETYIGMMRENVLRIVAGLNDAR